MHNKITDTIIPFVTPLNRPFTLRPVEKLTVSIRKGRAEVYNDGHHTISVPIWGYNGTYPGPLIEVRRDQTVTVDWKNKISEEESLPCVVESVEFSKGDSQIPADEPIPQSILDDFPADIVDKKNNEKIKPFFSVHLHGGKTIPGSDGWPESMLSPQKVDRYGDDVVQGSLCRYENKQRAMMLWFHDHAMHTTRLNNFVGLAGLWMIRDDEEDSLSLPAEEFEIPLVIQDRNLAGFNYFQDNDDESVMFRHRVEHGDGPLEFFGPLTLVNGSIWPRADVSSTAYRLRILNGSNSRFYRLRFAERVENGSNGKWNYKWLDTPIADCVLPVKQIGTDCGLMDAPVDLPASGLTLSPAERADIIIDFTNFEGREIVLLNTAESPFSNDPAFLDPLPPNDSEVVQYPERTLYPEVVMFCVSESDCKEQYKRESLPFDFDDLASRMMTQVETYRSEDPTLDSDGQTPLDLSTLNEGDGVKERTVVLVEKTEVHDGEDKVVLVEWELARKDEIQEKSSMPILHCQREVIICDDNCDNRDEFVVTAERFEDPVNWIVKLNSTERWRFINLTGDTHPMHVHLVQYKVVSRKGVDVVDVENYEDVVKLVDEKSKNNEPIEVNVTDIKEIDENEQGFKDTVRVNPGEIVEIVAKFEGYCGRYVYHCHLLEHEDHDMMRQFIVTRNDMDMSMHGLPISVGLATSDDCKGKTDK